MEQTVLEQFQNLDINMVDVQSDLFRTKYFTVQDLMKMLKEGNLNFISSKPLKPWNKRQQSLFIESILMGQPQQLLLLDGSNKKWYVVGGENELLALQHYLNNDFKLTNLTLSSPLYAGADYAGLSTTIKTRILNTKFISSVIAPGTSDVLRLWIYDAQFERMGIESHLYKCRRVIFPEVFMAMESLTNEFQAEKNNVNNYLWQLLVDMAMEQIGIHDNMFEKLFDLRMSYYYSILMPTYSLVIPYFRESQIIGDVMFLYQILNSWDLSDYTVKKKYCLMLLMTCMLSRQNDRDSIALYKPRFEKKWKKLKLTQEPFKGYTMRSVVACVEELNRMK